MEFHHVCTLNDADVPTSTAFIYAEQWRQRRYTCGMDIQGFGEQLPTGCFVACRADGCHVSRSKKEVFCLLTGLGIGPEKDTLHPLGEDVVTRRTVAVR